MDFTTINDRGLVLLGCGKMGSAMLQGWMSGGIDPAAVFVIEPYPTDWLQSLTELGLHLNGELPGKAAICVIAVKPQMVGEAAPALRALGDGATVFLSIAAGTSIATFEAAFGTDTPIVRAMPNTPAAIGRGISALIGNTHAGAKDLQLAEDLLLAVGQVVRLDNEAQMDAVTAVSGSGPAYVFHLIETLTAAGETQGLPPELALKLARATVAGAGDLAEQSTESPTQLRVNVTSPAGTTEAALGILMDTDSGFPALLTKAVKAAADRSRALG